MRIRNLISFLSRQLLPVLLLWGGLPAHELSAQVVDENTPKTAEYDGVGPTGDDFVAQSFIADVNVVTKIGAWVKMGVPNSKVYLMLCPADTNGNPDIVNFLFSSPFVVPDPSGLFYNFGGFTAPVTLGQKYFVVVDGFNNPTASGRAIVGLSGTYTDTGDDMVYSTDAGGSWDTLNIGSPTGPMAIYVEGDTCTTTVSITPPNPYFCSYDSVQISAGSGYLYYLWNTGFTGASFFTDTTAEFSVYVIDSSGCQGRDTVVVSSLDPPEVTLANSYDYCQGASVTVIPNSSGGTLQWHDGSTNIIRTFTTPGLIWVEITDGFGCRDRDSSQVIENPLPSPSLGNDTTVCIGQSIFLSIGPDFISWAWSNGTLPFEFPTNQPGAYWCEVTDSNGCRGNSDTLVLANFPAPVQPQIVLNGIALQATAANAWQWVMNGSTLGGQTGEFLTGLQTGYYQVIAIDTNGCEAISDSFFYEFIPQGTFISGGFSPNGDGVNEVFFVEQLSQYPDNSLTIFNRWGKEVFRAVNYRNDWNGTSVDGEPLPDGNYYYLLDFKNGEEPIRGVVLINR